MPPTANSSNFARRLFAQITTLDAVDYFVTDQEPPADLAAALRKGRVEVHWAPVPAPAQ